MLQALLYIELPRIAEFRLALATEMGGLLLTECGNQGSLARRAGVSISWAQGVQLGDPAKGGRDPTGSKTRAPRVTASKGVLPC